MDACSARVRESKSALLLELIGGLQRHGDRELDRRLIIHAVTTLEGRHRRLDKLGKFLSPYGRVRFCSASVTGYRREGLELF